MKLNQWIKLIIIACCVLSLTACHSRRYPNRVAAVDAANAAYIDSAVQARGLGAESRFGEHGGEVSHDRLISRRVYYFDFDSNVVHPQDRPAIAANGEYLLSHRRARVLLEGHTDPRGSREYNIGLGERRAKAVADILTAKGVDPSQIRIVSYGAEKLASPGHSEAAYQRDRRVVLVYMRR